MYLSVFHASKGAFNTAADGCMLVVEQLLGVLWLVFAFGRVVEVVPHPTVIVEDIKLQLKPRICQQVLAERQLKTFGTRVAEHPAVVHRSVPPGQAVSDIAVEVDCNKIVHGGAPGAVTVACCQMRRYSHVHMRAVDGVDAVSEPGAASSSGGDGGVKLGRGRANPQVRQVPHFRHHPVEDGADSPPTVLKAFLHAAVGQSLTHHTAENSEGLDCQNELPIAWTRVGF